MYGIIGFQVMDFFASSFHPPFSEAELKGAGADRRLRPLDLNEHLISHPSATFFMKIRGNRHYKHGFQDGDLIIIDRSLLPSKNSKLLVIEEGRFTLFSDLEFSQVIQADIDYWGRITYL
ncbi:MAG: hypothetical protein CUN55_17860, partial [Phototrophicales bacterium]